MRGITSSALNQKYPLDLPRFITLTTSSTHTTIYTLFLDRTIMGHYFIFLIDIDTRREDIC